MPQRCCITPTRRLLTPCPGVGGSSGACSLTCEAEVADVRGVCRWVRRDVDGMFSGAGGGAAQPPPADGLSLVLVGDSAGAPVAGSALDEDGVVGSVSMGYTFGWWAGILFSGHFPRIKASPVPKLFLMGSEDGFTSPVQLGEAVAECQGKVNDVYIVPGKGHFELEDPAYDGFKASRICDFLAAHVVRGVGEGGEGGAQGAAAE